jgi:solute carrier family 25 carnitine/acylcarnitine transporter 20/29
MQNDKEFKYRNSRHCLKELIRTEGIQGLSKGAFSTAAREIPSYSIQFATYEYLKIKYITPDHPHLNVWEALIVGPIAALNSWIVSYPQDVIKTKIQIE